MDVGTFELAELKFKPNLKGNVVDFGVFIFLIISLSHKNVFLGTKYSSNDLVSKFYPLNNTKTVSKFPANGQLRIHSWLTRKQLAKSEGFDSSKQRCLIRVPVLHDNLS